MNETSHQRSNRVQSVLMIVAMAGILGLCGFVVGDLTGFILALFGFAVIVVASNRVSAPLVLKMYKAVEIAPHQAPELQTLFAKLAARAELTNKPKLYYIPSKMMNAFAVGRGEASSIAVTDALLRNMNVRELAGVLAHEIAHIRHNDLFVMTLADAFSRVTTLLGQIGQILVLLSIPALFMGYDFPWIAALVLFFAPGASALIQLALSRSREYEADFGAAQITGDPMGLAQALNKIEQGHRNWFDQIIRPGRKVPEPALLRTHPPTAERIARLQALATPDQQYPDQIVALSTEFAPTENPRVVLRAPRWHVTGLWY